MHKILAGTLIVCVSTLVTTASAASVSWQSSTSGALWADKGKIESTAWDNDNGSYISVDEKTTYQEFDGHGGCINEVGWRALSLISESLRDSVLKMIFDSTAGCNFSNCRMPLGANDYSFKPGYSLNETKGDYEMKNFTIENDKKYLIPFAKAGMKYQPNLKVWGSPWSPPTWLKTSGNSLTNGSIKSDDQSFTAYALYFAKAVQAFQKEGLHYFAVAPQNEPFWGGGAYPVCQWEGSQMRDFIKKFLGPRFKQDDINAEIWLGTLNSSDDAGSRNMTSDVFGDSVSYSYCSGAGYQYYTENFSKVHEKYPDKRMMETETQCGGDISGNTIATNDWGYAEGNDNVMRIYYTGGANAFMQWNIVLPQEGRNWGNWSQNGMITIDTNQKTVKFNPQFYQVRHYKYVKPGAYRVATSGNYTTVVAFRNPDGENVLIVTNTGAEREVAINFNGQKIKPKLPAHSFNTFRVAGTPIPVVSPFTKIEAEKFDVQSGTLIRPCSDGGSAVTFIHNNDWAEYHNIDFGAGAKSFEARVSGSAGGTIEVHLDSCNGPASGTCTVPATAAWSTVSGDLTGVKGKHKLYLKFKGTGTNPLFSVNWVNFVAGEVGIATPSVKVVPFVNSIKVLSGTDSRQTLQISYSQSNSVKTIQVRLYDLSGRVAAELFSGQASSSGISIPLRNGIKCGTYLVKVTVEGAGVLTKRIQVQ
jgi:glucosylceramidase